MFIVHVFTFDIINCANNLLEFKHSSFISFYEFRSIFTCLSIILDKDIVVERGNLVMICKSIVSEQFIHLSIIYVRILFRFLVCFSIDLKNKNKNKVGI